MFSRCSSLENIDISNFDTSSVIDMSHMFEECISLYSINLSNFDTKTVENMDYMFANDDKLVYINFENMNDSNIKSMNNIFQGTLKNMVFCIDENKTSNFKWQIYKKKNCSIINCSFDWINYRLVIDEIDEDTFACYKDCSIVDKYFYNYFCVEMCPVGYTPYKFVCEFNKTSFDDGLNENDTECETQEYFLIERCKKKLASETRENKQKFIEATKNGLVKRKLKDLSLMATELGKFFTIRTPSEIYQIYSLTNKEREENLTYVDLEQCAILLNKKYGLNKLDEVIVFKIEYLSSNYKIPIIEYLLFGKKGRIKFRLEFCKNLKINYYIPKEINNYEEIKYKYDPENQYYHEYCYPHSENNKDLIIFDRRHEFNINNMSLCESNCKFKGYINHQIICECQIKTKFNSYLNNNTNADKYNLIHRFDTKISEHSFNIWVIKCYNLLLKKENLLSNKCAFIMISVLIINFFGAIIFIFYEYDKLIKKLQMTILLSIEKLGNKNEEQVIKFWNMKNKFNIKKLALKNKIFQSKRTNISNKQMNQSKELSSSSSSSNRIIKEISSNNVLFQDKNMIQNNILSKIKNLKLLREKDEIKEFLIKTDNELNSLEYKDALTLDNRKFCGYYISLIRIHNILIFSFHTKKDYNSLVIKICYFFYIYALIFTMNLLFIDNSTLYHIRLTNGFVNIFLFNFEKIIYATVISYFLKLIFSYLIFSEDIFLNIKNKTYFRKKGIIGHLGIKYVAYFGLAIISLLFFIYYNMCFFAVFPNIQIYAIELSGISIALLMIIPLIINIIPAIIRMYSLQPKTDRELLYKFSQILQII